MRLAIAIVLVALVVPTGAFNVAAAGGQSEGIKVHGDWTIEIREPNGTLVNRHEFKNSLIAGGANSGNQLLAKLLGKTETALEWQVLIANGQDAAGGPCSDTNFVFGFVTRCHIIPANSTLWNIFGPVTKTLVVNSTSAGTLELSGTVTAARAGAISVVETYVRGNPSVYSFTSRALPSAIMVAAGQIIQVKVVISFS